MMRLYPPRSIVGQSYVGEKIITQPDQSMTLRDIIKRFIRKESLPIQKDGLYAENLGDLEKIAREDITLRMERADQLKKGREKAEKAYEAKNAAPPPTPKEGGEAQKPATGEGGASPPPTTA